MSRGSASDDAVDAAPHRVRTYHARRGRLSAAHVAALSSASRWSLESSGPPVDLDQVFGRRAPVVLDVGCGMGESTRAQASADIATDVIAADVHTRGIATLLRGVETDGLANVRVVHGDVVTLLEQRLGAGSLAGARVYFPDPWPKVRHAKRRLIQPPFVRLLTSRLAPGGFVHCATDDAEYAAQMRAVLQADRLLTLHDSVPADVRRPQTKYERRARRLGHPVVDLWATRTLSP
jgi:tRNA (guanine-N7-)-methyltransferase